MDNLNKKARVYSTQTRATNNTYTHYFSSKQSITSRDTAHIYGKNLFGKKRTDTHEFPRTTQRFPPIYFAHGRTDRTYNHRYPQRTGHFWTDQDQWSQGLRFGFLLFLLSCFHCSWVVVVAADDDNDMEYGRAVFIVFYF